MRPVLLAFAALLSIVVFAACGGGDSDAEPAATATASDPSGTQEQPSATTAPVATATTEPSPTTAPSPTPPELTFTSAQGGNGTVSGQHTGLFNIVFADAGFNALYQNNRAQAFAFVNAGISEEPAASAWIFNDFTAPDLGSSTVEAQVSSDVSWRGVLAGNGLIGTKAAVDITLQLLEDGQTIASEVVHSNELQESVLTLGGFDDVGSAPANFNATLVPGRRYRIQLRVDCEARSGILAASTHCIFGPSDTYDDGYVEWTSLSILFS